MQDQPYPQYFKLSLNLLTIVLIGCIIYLGQSILLPLVSSALLATLLLPVVNFLERKKIPRIPAILLCLTVSLIILGAVFYFLYTQVSNFLADSQKINKELNDLFKEAQRWISSNLHIGIRKQNQYIEETAKNIKSSSPKIISQTVISITRVVSYVVFIPIYTFLLLYYRQMLKRFVCLLFQGEGEKHLTTILSECQSVSHHYIMGLMIDMTIVFCLNSAGFLIINIPYGIFLGLIAALLNLVPYVGMLTANVFCMLITLISTSDFNRMIWVGVVLGIVQLIDNNLLMTLVVGTKVRMNALVTILAVLIGGTLAGVDGMFLAIPTVAVMKVIFDRVDSLKPWGLLLGDIRKTSEKPKRK